MVPDDGFPPRRPFEPDMPHAEAQPSDPAAGPAVDQPGPEPTEEDQDDA